MQWCGNVHSQAGQEEREELLGRSREEEVGEKEGVGVKEERVSEREGEKRV